MTTCEVVFRFVGTLIVLELLVERINRGRGF